MSKAEEYRLKAITIQELLKGVDSTKEIDTLRELSNYVQILAQENKELIKRLQESQDQEMILGMAYDKYKKENKELIELLGKVSWLADRGEMIDIHLRNKIQKAIR